MAEYITNAVQEVPVNGTVYYNTTAEKGNCHIIHRAGSGNVTLKGGSNTSCHSTFKVSFGGNIAVPTGGTAGAISLAIAIDGEPVVSSTMISTPTAVDAYNNVFSSVFIDVPKCCCSTVSVVNTSSQAINVQNANFIITAV